MAEKTCCVTGHRDIPEDRIAYVEQELRREVLAAIQANTYGGIYPDEIKALQRDYADLWGPLSDLLKSCRRWWRYK